MKFSDRCCTYLWRDNYWRK